MQQERQASKLSWQLREGCPKRISGKASQCKGFLLQFSLYSSGQANVSDHQEKPSDRLPPCGSKAERSGDRSIGTLHRAEGDNAFHIGGVDAHIILNCFVELFQRVFDHTLDSKETREQLLTIREKGVLLGTPLSFAHWQQEVDGMSWY